MWRSFALELYGDWSEFADEYDGSADSAAVMVPLQNLLA
jgi:hypothetical protein